MDNELVCLVERRTASKDRIFMSFAKVNKKTSAGWDVMTDGRIHDAFCNLQKS